jgi:hypothetical protein
VHAEEDGGLGPDRAPSRRRVHSSSPPRRAARPNGERPEAVADLDELASRHDLATLGERRERGRTAAALLTTSAASQ